MHTQNHSHTPVTPSAPATIPPAETAPTLTFAELALVEPLQRALGEKNYTVPSPIQAKAIPFLLQGRDLIGVAQTGTGKTAAFALPILQRLAAHPAPTTPKRPRALDPRPDARTGRANRPELQRLRQVPEAFLTPSFSAASASRPQIRTLARGVDILIATPGRLQDLERSKHVVLDKVEVFVLDEADRMLDLGFVHEIKRIITKLPPEAPVAAFLGHHAARDPGTRLVNRAQSRARGGDARFPRPWSGSSSTSPT